MVLGSTAGTVREVVRKMREKGEKVGTISLTLYRPFPEEELKKVLKGVKVLAVMDRSYSFGSPGAQLFMDVTATLINMKEKPLIFNVIYGLGGRDLVPNHVLSIIEKAKEYAELGEVSEKEIWIGVRE